MIFLYKIDDKIESLKMIKTHLTDLDSLFNLLGWLQVGSAWLGGLNLMLVLMLMLMLRLTIRVTAVTTLITMVTRQNVSHRRAQKADLSGTLHFIIMIQWRDTSSARINSLRSSAIALQRKSQFNRVVAFD